MVCYPIKLRNGPRMIHDTRLQASCRVPFMFAACTTKTGTFYTTREWHQPRSLPMDCRITSSAASDITNSADHRCEQKVAMPSKPCKSSRCTTLACQPWLQQWHEDCGASNCHCLNQLIFLFGARAATTDPKIFCKTANCLLPVRRRFVVSARSRHRAGHEAARLGLLRAVCCVSLDPSHPSVPPTLVLLPYSQQSVGPDGGRICAAPWPRPAKTIQATQTQAGDTTSEVQNNYFDCIGGSSHALFTSVGAESDCCTKRSQMDAPLGQIVTALSASDRSLLGIKTETLAFNFAYKSPNDTTLVELKMPHNACRSMLRPQ